MAAHEYAFTLTPGNSSRPRSITIACAAIAAVCVLSSTVVMRELAGAPTARAVVAPTAIRAAVPIPAATAAPALASIPALVAIPTAPPVTAAPAWTLQPRWWPGEIRQIKRSAPALLDTELTFTKGYQLRLAARQATQPAAQPDSAPAQAAQPVSAQIAAGPTGENQSVRTAPRKATTIAHTETPTVRRVNATQVEPSADPFARFDVGTRALSYDEQRPRERGLAYRSAPSRGLFGTLY
jgi:hypothetical protein